MTKAVQIITNRVEATGLTGASVVQQGKDEIVVSVPGAGAQKVATLVGETALLRLRQVLYVRTQHHDGHHDADADAVADVPADVGERRSAVGVSPSTSGAPASSTTARRDRRTPPR